MTDFEDLNNKLESYHETKTQQLKEAEEDTTFSLRSQICFFSIGFGYGGLLLISILVSLICGAFLTDKSQLSMALNAGCYTILFVVFLILIFIFDKKAFIKKLKKLQNWVIGIGFGVLIIFAEILLSFIISLFYQGGVNANQEQINLLFQNYPLLSFIIFCIIGPFCEEFTYRVGLFDLLKRKSKLLAYIIEILIFSFMHIQFTNTTLAAELASLPIYMAIAFLLTLAYDKSDLSGSLVAHIMINSISFISVLFA